MLVNYVCLRSAQHVMWLLYCCYGFDHVCMYQILGTGGDLCYEMEYERQRHLVIRS